MDGTAIVNLTNALTYTFAIIALGYVARRENWLGPDAAPGIGQLCGRFGLPALLFRSCATVNLARVDPAIIGGTTVAKLVVGLAAAALGRLTCDGNSEPLLRAGMFMIFVTNEAATAVGLPLVKATYSKQDDDNPDGPNYVSLLYFLAAMQSCIITPIALLLCELGKLRRSGDRGKSKGFAAVVFEVAVETARNPLVFATVAGVVFNFITGAWLPLCVLEFLNTLGAVFTGGVLLLTGMSMVGNGSQLHGRGLVFPTVLSALKMLALPLVARYVTMLFQNFNEDGLPRDHVDRLNFAFLYGSIPAAASTLVISRFFNAEVGLMSGSLVLCLLASAPLMFMTSVLFSVDDMDVIASVVTALQQWLSVVSICGATWVVLGLAASSRRRRYPMIGIAILAMLQLGYHGAHLQCTNDGSDITYIFSNIFRLAVRGYLCGLCLLMVRDMRWRHTGREGYPPHTGMLTLANLGVNVAYGCFVTLTFYFNVAHVKEVDDPAMTCWYRYGFAQKAVDVVVFSIQIAAITWAASYSVSFNYRREIAERASAENLKGLGRQEGDDEDKTSEGMRLSWRADDEETRPLFETPAGICRSASPPPPIHSPFPFMGPHFRGVALTPTPKPKPMPTPTPGPTPEPSPCPGPNPGPNADPNADPDPKADRRLGDARGASGAGETLLPSRALADERVDAGLQHRFRVQVLMSHLLMRLCVQLAVVISVLSCETVSGSVEAILFLCVIMVDGQGALTCVAFGFQADYTHPIATAWLRFMLYLAGASEAEARERIRSRSRAQPLGEGISRVPSMLRSPEELAELIAKVYTTSGIVRLKNWGFRGERGPAILGSDLVTYLVATGQADTRRDAVRAGDELMYVGFIYHALHQGEPFRDDYVFYGIRVDGILPRDLATTIPTREMSDSHDGYRASTG